MRVLTRISACLTLFLLFAGAPAGAQVTSSPADQSGAALEALLGRTITEVRIRIGGRESQDVDLLQALETRTGRPLIAAEVRESIVHLMALARFDDVRVEAEPAGAGVALAYVMAPVRTVRAVAFRGDLGISARQLKKIVEDRYSSSPAMARADEIAAMLEAECRDRGFLNATVRPVGEAMETPEHIRLVFEVAAGPPAKVRKAEVEGAPGGNAAEVIRQLGLEAGARFDRAALDASVLRYARSLRSGGYLEARVEPDFAFSSNNEAVDVTVRMKRGPRVSISFAGDPLPEKRRQQILDLLGEGTLDEDVLENEQASIENDLRARGYRDAAAPYRREPSGEAQLRIVFTVAQGPQYKVGDIEILGNEQLTRAEIQPVLRVVPGQWFVESRVQADAEAVRGLYLRLGFRRVEVSVATAARPSDATQLVSRFTIVEGPRTTVSSLEFLGVASLPVSVLEQAIVSRAGGPFHQAQVEVDREAVLYQYQALGYQQATVTVPPGLSEDGTRFALRFQVDEGARTLLDHVLVVGNARTKTRTIERALALTPGAPLSFLTLAEAQRRVSALGLFRRVQLVPLERNIGNRRDLLVTVEEAPVNTIGYGGGLEASLRLRTNAATGVPEEKLDVAPRGFFEVGRRNLWGKNRSVAFFMRGAIRTSDEFNTEESNQPLAENQGAGFREYRVLGSYREPRFMDLPVDILITGAIDQAIRSSFDFNRRQIFLEASHRFPKSLAVAGRYSFGHTRLFNARIAPESQLDVDKVFPTVRLSSFSGSLVLSTRDDAFEPTRGFLTGVDVMVAPRAIGSEVGFIKGSWQGFTYKQIPWLRGAVLAGGARIGLAIGSEQTVTDENGNTTVIDQELPASERFFAGGDTTVRGWALDRLGSQAVLDENGVSNGGNGLLILNAELRVPILRQKSLAGAIFLDAGNVFAAAGDIDLGELRVGSGFGLRWKSPVGPLRMDFAWKLHPITFANGQPENRFAWYVTIGQAF